MWLPGHFVTLTVSQSPLLPPAVSSKGPEMVAEPIPRPLWMQMRGWTHAVAAVPQGSCPQPAEPSCGEQGGTAREHPYVDRAMLHRCPERRLTKPQHHPKEYENRRFVIVSH